MNINVQPGGALSVQLKTTEAPVIIAAADVEAIKGRRKGRTFLQREYGFSQSVSRFLVIGIQQNVFRSDQPEGADWIDKRFSEDKATVNAISLNEIRTLEELLEVCEMDEDEWRVKDWSVKTWRIPVKNEHKQIEDRPAYYISARFERDKERIFVRDVVQEMMGRLPPKPYIYKERKEGDLLAVLHMPDPHFGKVPARMEMTLDDQEERFVDVAHQLVSGFSHLPVQRVMVPVGHDFAHIDYRRVTRKGTWGMTQSGTPIDYLADYHDMYLTADRAGERMVDMLLDMGFLVDLVIVPGNHDETTAFTLGHGWTKKYAKYEEVRIDNSKPVTKYYQYGRNGLMLTHGHTVKWADMPMHFAASAPELWSQSVWRELLPGHLHTMRGAASVITRWARA